MGNVLTSSDIEAEEGSSVMGNVLTSSDIDAGEAAKRVAEEQAQRLAEAEEKAKLVAKLVAEEQAKAEEEDHPVAIAIERQRWCSLNSLVDRKVEVRAELGWLAVNRLLQLTYPEYMQCKCGYTCGTFEAMHVHLHRFSDTLVHAEIGITESLASALVCKLFDYGPEWSTHKRPEVLLLSARRGLINIMKHLLNCDQQLQCQVGQEALLEALSCNRWDSLSFLAQQGVDLQTQVGSSVLQAAVERDRLDFVELCVKRNALSSEMFQEVLLASASFCRIQILRLLVNAKENSKFLTPSLLVSAFRTAVETDDLCIVKELVEHMGHCDLEGGCQLWEYAAKRGKWAVAKGLAHKKLGWDVFGSFEQKLFLADEWARRKVRWQFERNDGWIDVGSEMLNSLECSYTGDPHHRSPIPMKVGGVEYIVDLSRMVQVNSATGRERKLRRLQDLPEEFVEALSIIRAKDILTKRIHKHSDHFPDSRCAEFHNIELISIDAITCEPLWHRYRNAALELKDKHRRFRVNVAQHISPQELTIHSLDASINEGFYFHGTKTINVEKIVKFGFDERFSEGIYGDGLYFTPDACKALQYTDCAGDGTRTLFLARVLVGDAFYAKTTRNGRHAPEREGAEPGLLYDSVVAVPGDMDGAPSNRQYHTEVVIFNGAQTYPSYILRLKL